MAGQIVNSLLNRAIKEGIRSLHVDITLSRAPTFQNTPWLQAQTAVMPLRTACHLCLPSLTTTQQLRAIHRPTATNLIPLVQACPEPMALPVT